MVFPRVAGTRADVEALCDDKSGVYLDGDEGVFWEEMLNGGEGQKPNFSNIP